MARIADNLSRRQIKECWPYDQQKVDNFTLWRWLDRAVKEGLPKQSGLGRKFAPFVYWLPCNEERWALNPAKTSTCASGTNAKR